MRRGEFETGAFWRRADQRAVDHERDVAFAAVLHERANERFGLHDPRVRRPDRRRGTGDVRLALKNEAAIDERRARDAVAMRALQQTFERAELRMVVRDDELAAADVRHVVRRAEVVQAIAPFDAQRGLERASRVVQTRVNHAAVARAGAVTEPRIALEQAHRRAAIRERARRRQSDHPTTNDRDVDVHLPLTIQKCPVIRPSVRRRYSPVL